MTALIMALRHQKMEIFELLLENGAEINKKDRYGWTAIMWAAKENKYDLVRRLLDMGAKGSRVVLSLAIKAGDKDMVERLISSGVDINAPEETIPWLQGHK